MKNVIYVIFTLAIIMVNNFCLANEETTNDFWNKPGVAYLVVGDGVRVRTHPTTNGYIICTLSKGEWVKAFNYDSRGVRDSKGLYWKYIVMSNGSVGWIASKYLSLRC